ncbi:MAG: EF-hand domain-containing protein [Sphingopyxis sp.]|nr:EF-hand domain-containing protein [Sphingopyxis sp.]
MKKFSLLLGTFAAAIAAPALGAPDGARGNVDSDDNGVLTRTEVEADVAKRFAKLDANKDGKVDDGDRAAHRAERQNAMFAALDSDRNGSVSRAEFDAAAAARDTKRAERRAQRVERGNASEEMRGKHGGRRHGHGGRMLGMVDSNGDKAITLEEMRAAALARFDRIDANKDGQVTTEERAAMRGMRGDGRRGGAAATSRGE